MNLIKVLTDVLDVYNQFEYLENELNSGKPVCYYSHFKVQKITLTSGTKCLMVSKFDYCTSDFVRFCDMTKFDESYFVIYDVICIRTDTGTKSNFINSIHNYSNRIDGTLTKDQYFNIQLEYDIPYQYEEIMKVLQMSKLIKSNVWVYNE